MSPANARARWKRLRCVLLCVKQFAEGKTGAKALAYGTLIPFEPGTWHRHKLERFQNAYNKAYGFVVVVVSLTQSCSQDFRTDTDLKLLMEIVQSVSIFARASYMSKLYICRSLECHVLHDGEVVFHQGDKIDLASGVYVILEGVVSVYANSKYEFGGVSYPTWFQSTHPAARDDEVQFGTCTKTASVGDVFGETALTGFLYRQSTVLAQSRAKVAFLSQSNFRRIMDQNESHWHPQHCILTIETEPHKRSLPQTRDAIAFLNHFRFFQAFPRDVIELLSHRLRHRTFKANDILCQQADADGKLIVVVAGRVLLYVQDTAEEARCRPYAPLAAATPVKVHAVSKPQLLLRPPSALLAEKVEYDATYGWCVGELGGGECFGEQGLATGLMPSATLRAISTTSAVILYQAELDQVLEQCGARPAMDRKPTDELAHLVALLQVPPMTRTPADARDIQAALVRCEGNVFFGQFSPVALNVIAYESTIRVADAGTILLQQDHTCDHMFVILHGTVNIHRLTAKRKQRRRSTCIRLELHHDHATPLPPATFGAEIFETCGQFLSSLPVGSAFGHSPVLTSSHSQSSFVVGRNLAKGGAATYDHSHGDAGTVSATLLCLPARFVKSLLRTLDDTLLYNPRLVLEQATKPDSILSMVKLANFLQHKPAFAALPEQTLARLLVAMQVGTGIASSSDWHQVVEVPYNRLLWEQGEKMCNAVIVVLSGSIMLVRSGHRGSVVDAMLKPSDTTDHKLVLNVARTANTVTLMNSTDQVTLCGAGDVIGSLGESDADWATAKPYAAMTTTETKVGILQWPRVYAPVPTVAKQCADILVLRTMQLQLLQELKDGSGSAAGEPTGIAEDINAAVTHLLALIEWKDKFPVPVQAHIAELFSFVRIDGGDPLFRQDDEAHALYIIVAGCVKMQVVRTSPYTSKKKQPIKRESTRSRQWTEPRKFVTSDVREDETIKMMQHTVKDSVSSPTTQLQPHAPPTAGHEPQLSKRQLHRHDAAAGDVEAKLGPGDVLGELALFRPGVRHRATATAETDTTVLVLTRMQYDHLLLHGRTNSTSLVVVRNPSERAREHWKLVIHYIVKNRSQRSHWPSVIEFARQKRIRLVMDIVKDVPAFQAIGHDDRMKVCERTLFQTYAPNAVVFEKGKPVERFFVIVTGSVDLIQVSGLLDGPSNLAAVDVDGGSAMKIRTLRDGEWFGEYEIIANEATRQIMAVTSDGVRLVAVYKGEFLAMWPTLQTMTERLRFLKQCDALGGVEDDRFCSIWYGIARHKFRRNDVIVAERDSATKAPESILWIEDGECVVYQSLTLVRSIKEKKSQEKDVRLEMQVATLTRGNVLFCEDATWKRSTLVATTQHVHVFVLTYPAHPTMLFRVVGKRGIAALRRIMRIENDFQQGQKEAATRLAVASEPKPIDSPILPLLKCVPVARLRGNRMKLPSFLLQRHVPTMDLTIMAPQRDEDGPPARPPLPSTPLWATSQPKPTSSMTGSFDVTPHASSSPRVTDAPPPCFSPMETAQVLRPKIRWEETENSAVRMQRALNQQIQEEAKLVHELDISPHLRLKQTKKDNFLRIKHGRPVLCPQDPFKLPVPNTFKPTLHAQKAPTRATPKRQLPHPPKPTTAHGPTRRRPVAPSSSSEAP
ncbi:Aste57867_13201 [Aphanomyces stellatus]|uniref:Aste57867_13201 protein n=1 Tax=Aphanomyces stellatus TaxID=120398 RepID=A0A485KXT4_9STRA|nr:hypothetical protein As57867_013152 [Aphanomyces stellatus]VFT90041.1 Aste57867_13201 [Aphanomyces stellatus]